MANDPPMAGSPEWYRDSLINDLNLRDPLCCLYEAYYEGRHSLAFLPAKLRRSMGAMLSAVGDNYMPMVVQSKVERLSVLGFMSADSDDLAGDKDAWEMWNANDLQEHEPMLWAESSKHGEAYLLVWGPDDTTAGQPKITLEHPGEMAVMRDPADRTRVLAALKRWQVDADEWFCNLWLPGRILRYRGGSAKGGTDGWKARELDGVPHESPVPSAVGVPVIPIINDPSMLPSRPPTALIEWPHGIPSDASVGLGRSDLADVIGTQDSLNGTLVDAHSASRYQGFRLRYAIGVETPTDDDGNDVPIDVSPGSLLTLDYDTQAGDPEPKLGDLAAADLGQFIDLAVQRIQSLSSRARIPVHYLLSGRIQLPGGDALRGAEAGLNAKVAGTKKTSKGALSRTISTGFAWLNDPRAKQRWITQWAPHEFRTESEHADAVGKTVALLNLPIEQGWREMGYGPDDIARFRAMLQRQVMEAVAWAAMGVTDPNQKAPETVTPPPAEPTHVPAF